MSSSLFTLAVLSLISLLQIHATAARGAYGQGRNIIQFGNMISQTLGTSALSYNGYGCWCGLGGEGEPVDGTDACCRDHDQCFDRIIESRPSVFSCSPYLSFYDWDLDATTLLPYCKDAPGTCGHSVCECDRIVTECYKRNAHTFIKGRKCPK